MIIWTRSSDDWCLDAPLLSDCDDEIIRLPCIKICSLPESDVNRQIGPDPSDKEPYISVFTSSHAAAFCHHLKKVRQIVEHSEAVWAVGQATLFQLKTWGVCAQMFPEVAQARDLGDELLQKYHGRNVRFFLPGGRLRAYNLESFLRLSGFRAHSVNLYETRSGCWFPSGRELEESDRKKIQEHFDSSIVCFASPSAVRGFATCWNINRNSFRRLKVVAIGTSTEEACREYFRNVTKAPVPTLEALKNAARLQLDRNQK